MNQAPGASARELATNSLLREEGRRPTLYLDTEGVLTIGVGYALERLVVTNEVVEEAVAAKRGRKAKPEVTKSTIKLEPINSLPKDVIDYLTDTKILSSIVAASKTVERYDNLSENRQAVLIEMAYQLGEAGLMSFVKMRAAVSKEDFGTAAAEMLESKWATQTPERAARLAGRMVAG